MKPTPSPTPEAGFFSGTNRGLFGLYAITLLLLLYAIFDPEALRSPDLTDTVRWWGFGFFALLSIAATARAWYTYTRPARKA